jgi:hypothetical protein
VTAAAEKEAKKKKRRMRMVGFAGEVSVFNECSSYIPNGLTHTGASSMLCPFQGKRSLELLTIAALQPTLRAKRLVDAYVRALKDSDLA